MSFLDILSKTYKKLSYDYKKKAKLEGNEK